MDDRKVIGHGNCRIGYLAPRNPARSHPSSSIAQKAGSRVPSSYYKPNGEAIRLPIARLRRRYKRGPKLRQALPDTSECFSRAGRISDRTHGRDSGWVRNVLAVGRCQLETRLVTYQLSKPVIVNDPTRRRFPLLVRVVLGLIDANDYLQLSTSVDGASRPHSK